MPITILILILAISAIMSALFIFRDAKSFALAPPTPLIDLDRMYDYIFTELDEETGKIITPLELKKILYDFLKLFSDHQLISEDVTGPGPAKKEQFTPDYLAAAIKKQDPKLEVPALPIKKVMTIALTYLANIGALT